MTVPQATAEPTAAPAVELTLNIGGTELVNGVHTITGDSITFNWTADGAVSDYYIYVYKQNGGVFYQNEATSRTSGTFGADSLTPGEVYTITVGALPEGGDESGMVWAEARFSVPAADPTEVPTAEPTEEPDDGTVDPESSVEEIKYVQQLLISAGLLSEGGDDGDYGKGTASAVLEFQQYVNDYFGDAVLEETGIADALTIQYLEEFVSRGMTVPADEPTEAPTAEPTAEPDPTEVPTAEPTEAPVEDDGSVTPESSAEDVRYMQQLLISAGVLSEGSDDGDYGKGTANAVLKFQQYVNDYFGDAVLEETGVADAETMKYLEEFVSRGMTVPSDEPTEAPTAEPTAEPDPTEAPVEDDGSVTPESSAEDVRYMQQLLISAGVLSEGSDDGDYGKGTANAVLKFQQYVNDYFGDAVLDETGIADAETMKYLEEFVSRGMTVPSDEPTEAPTAEPTAEPDPTEAPTAEPTEAPTEAPEPTEPPVPVIAINDVEYDADGEEIPTIDTSLPTVFSWTCDGDVKGFMLYMTNSANEKKELDKTTESFVELDLSTLPADTYMLWVGAVPSDAQSEADVVWSAVTFIIAG